MSYLFIIVTYRRFWGLIGKFGLISLSRGSSIEEVLDEFLELVEVDLARVHRVNLLKGQLELLLVHVGRLTEELVELVERDAMVLVDVQLLEDLLQALLRQELLLVHAHHHELVQADQPVARAVSHRDHVVHALLVEIGAEVLPVPVDQLRSGQCSITTCIQVREHLLQLDSIVHVQKVLNQVAQRSLLRNILRAKRPQVRQGPCHILPSLMHLGAVIFFFHAASQLEPRVLEGVGGGDTIVFLAENSGNEIFGLWTDFVPSGAVEGVLADFDLVDDFFVCGAVKRRFTGEQNVEDDTYTPYVTFLTVCALDNLRSHVVARAENTMHGMFIIHSARCTKVNKFDDSVFLVLEVNILRFDVAVDDRILMQVVDCADQLPDHIGGLHFVKVKVRSHSFI